MNRELVQDLASGAAILILALGASLARQQGYIDSDATTRIVLCAIGLQVAWFGNRMPKKFVPNAAMRRVTRIAGWSMALSGLIYAALWIFAPIPVALIGGCGAIIAGIAISVGACLAARNAATAA